MFVIDKTDAVYAPLIGADPRKQRHYVTNVVKMTFTIGGDGTLTPLPKSDQPGLQGDVTYMDDLGRSLKYPSDIPERKPLVDVTVNADACAPGGEPVTRLPVALSVAGHRKELLVYGNRRWQTDEAGLAYISDPESFTRMPLRWENSFGGMTIRQNPLGKGQGAAPGTERDETPVYPLPNVEDPNNLIGPANLEPAPVGFGAIPVFWETRERKFGTRDLFWANFRAPDPPKDYDPRYENAAPDDQQFQDLRGDEILALENMDPEQPHFRIALPALRPRLFFVPFHDTDRQLRPLDLRLDTVHVDMHDRQLTMLWRGTFEHGFEDFPKATAYLYLETEPLYEPLSDTAYQDKFNALLPDYELAFEAETLTAESMHEKIFPTVIDAIVKAFQDVEADESVIATFQSSTDPQTLYEKGQNLHEEKTQAIHEMLEAVKRKYGQN